MEPCHSTSGCRSRVFALICRDADTIDDVARRGPFGSPPFAEPGRWRTRMRPGDLKPFAIAHLYRLAQVTMRPFEDRHAGFRWDG